MIGKEIADAIAPIVMWIAIVGGALGLVGLIVWRIRKSAKIEQLHEVQSAGQEEERDARRNIKDRTASMRARLLARARLRGLSHDEGGELPGASGTVSERDGPGTGGDPPG